MPRIRINNCQVELLRQGAGQPVVLLHGSGSTSAQWRALADRLSTRFLVLAPDLYGYGGTGPWPGHGDFSLAAEAAMVQALLDSLDEPAHLVGHSYGGAVALQVALTQPRALRSLALVEPMACHLLRGGDDSDRAALREFTEVGNRVVQSLCRGDYLGGFGRFVDYWNGPGTWRGIPLDRRIPMAASLGKVALDFSATLGEAAGLDGPGPAVPTLLVRGSHTAPPAQRIFQRLSAAWPAARTHVIPGAGHMAPVTHRDQVNGLLAAHLEQAAASCLEAVA